MSHPTTFSAFFNLLTQASLPLFRTLLPCTVDAKYLKSRFSSTCSLLSLCHQQSPQSMEISVQTHLSACLKRVSKLIVQAHFYFCPLSHRHHCRTALFNVFYFSDMLLTPLIPDFLMRNKTSFLCNAGNAASLVLVFTSPSTASKQLFQL